MNDNDIIHKTKVLEVEGKDYVELVIELPDGEEFKQRAKDADSAKKHIMAWCDSVRGHWDSKQAAKREEQEARIARRKAGLTEEAPEKPQEARTLPPSTDPRVGVLEWYERTQARIDELSDMIEACKDERDRLRDERDKITPVIKAWQGGEDV